MRTIALINQKGGVGKTTSALNIGAGLIKLGQHVLLIDLDPQAHLTYSLGIQAHTLKETIYELLKGETQAQDIIIKRTCSFIGTPKGDTGKYCLDILPSTINLSGAEIELSGIAGREFLLRESLNHHKDYDYVLIDCPPSLGLLTLNGLTTAQEVYIPLQTEFLALQGMSKLLETVEVVQKRLNKRLEITGVILTRYDNRKVLNKEIAEKIRQHFKGKVFNTIVRDNISLAEAPSYGQTIYEYKPNSYGSEDYLNLCKEITKRNK